MENSRGRGDDGGGPDVTEPHDESAKTRNTFADCGERTSSDEIPALFRRLRADETRGEVYREIRNQLVLRHMHLAERIAWQFRGRGEPIEDLLQVARVGLIEAVERFDSARGVEFRSFAVPTITGVIKRHFRDRAWLLAVPRRLKQLHRPLDQARVEFTQRYGRAPTVAELAARLQVSVRDVVETFEIANAYTALSLDGPALATDSGQMMPATRIGIDDVALHAVESRESVLPLVRRLSTHEKTVLFLRFFRDQTETQIAEHLGTSQARVSRILTRTLTSLRNQLRAS